MGEPELRQGQLLPGRLWRASALPPPGAPRWRLGRAAGAGPRLPRGDRALPEPVLLELYVRRRHAQRVLRARSLLRGQRG